MGRSAKPAQIATVAAQLASALAALSQYDIRHGDIKPENILVESNGHGPHATLIDFGLATAASTWAIRAERPAL